MTLLAALGQQWRRRVESSESGIQPGASVPTRERQLDTVLLELIADELKPLVLRDRDRADGVAGAHISEGSGGRATALGDAQTTTTLREQAPWTRTSR